MGRMNQTDPHNNDLEHTPAVTLSMETGKDEVSATGRDRTVCIVGTGSYLPDRILTNTELAKMVDTSDEWIRSMTGIRERHIARDDETPSEMSFEAAKHAMASAGVSPDDIELIIVATVTPEMIFPSTACFVQELIGAKKALCFDMTAACSGFLYAIETARQFITAGTLTTALVIGMEKMSCITDWKDRSTCVLFGDGAGACVMQAREKNEQRGIIASLLGSDGALADLLKVPGGGGKHPASKQTVEDGLHYIKMAGNEVLKHAVRCMCDAGEQVLKQSGLTIDDVDCIIPHQANLRIIKAIANRLGDCIDKFYLNLESVGNMSAASIPVALDEAVRCGRVKKGDTVLLVVFGGGFTWGAMVMEW